MCHYLTIHHEVSKNRQPKRNDYDFKLSRLKWGKHITNAFPVFLQRFSSWVSCDVGIISDSFSFFCIQMHMRLHCIGLVAICKNIFDFTVRLNSRNWIGEQVFEAQPQVLFNQSLEKVQSWTAVHGRNGLNVGPGLNVQHFVATFCTSISITQGMHLPGNHAIIIGINTIISHLKLFASWNERQVM